MSLWVWPAEIEMVLGALGVSLALWSLQRRQAGKPMHPDAAKADVGLLVFGALLVLVGVARQLAI